jgi:hypothetical protein
MEDFLVGWSVVLLGRVGTDSARSGQCVAKVEMLKGVAWVLAVVVPVATL